MDGRGSWRDNVFVERLWRTVKYEEVYLRAYDSVAEARSSIGSYLTFYNGKKTREWILTEAGKALGPVIHHLGDWVRWPGLSEQRFGSDRWFPCRLSPSIAVAGRRVGRA